MHHWISVEHTLAAYARTLSDIADGTTRIGQGHDSRCRRRQRSGGTAGAYLTETLDGRIVLDAQSHLVEWYERLGFAVVGPEFVEDGIPRAYRWNQPCR